MDLSKETYMRTMDLSKETYMREKKLTKKTYKCEKKCMRRKRTTNSTWSADELWVLPSGTTNMTKETYMCEKRSICVKRGPRTRLCPQMSCGCCPPVQHIATNMCETQSDPICVKRDLCKRLEKRPEYERPVEKD